MGNSRVHGGRGVRRGHRLLLPGLTVGPRGPCCSFSRSRGRWLGLRRDYVCVDARPPDPHLDRAGALRHSLKVDSAAPRKRTKLRGAPGGTSRMSSRY